MAPSDEERNLSVTVNREASTWVIRLEGDCALASVTELRSLLVEAFSSGKHFELDLLGVEQIDVAVMQLLWTAGREAGLRKVSMVCQVNQAAAEAAREAGFEPFPGAADDV
jgi:hypothetical protein